MQRVRFQARAVLTAAAASAALAACSAQNAQPLPMSTQSLPQSVRAGAAAKSLFVADPLANEVRIFAAGVPNGPQIGAIKSGISFPQGLFIDSRGVLYVANSRAVTEYKPGALTPFRTLTGVNGGVSLTVDSSGTVYAGQNCSIVPAGGSIAVFEHGSTVPTRSIALQECSFMGGLTIDRAGNLIASFFQYPAKILHVQRFAPGSSTGVETGIQGIAEIGATLVIDRAGNLYADGPASVNVYAPGAKTPTRSITTGVQSPTGIALDSAGNLYVANYPGAPGASFINEYAAGGSIPVNTFSGNLSTLAGVAVRPAQ